MSVPGRLVIVGGPPASGKTTLAREIAERRGAIRLSPDEWLTELAIDLEDASARDRVEALQRALALSLVARGLDVVLDWGVFRSAARDRLRRDARSVGAAVELHFLDGPPDELWERMLRRAEDGGQPVPSRKAFDAMLDEVQPPDATELAAFDPPA